MRNFVLDGPVYSSQTQKQEMAEDYGPVGSWQLPAESEHWGMEEGLHKEPMGCV